MNTETQTPNHTETPVGARHIDTSRGSQNTALSSQWWNRPDDQRFLSLDDLRDAVALRGDASTANIVDVTGCKVSANDQDDALYIEDQHGQSVFEHWSFGQMAGLLNIPAGYLRKLPPQIAGINLQFALKTFRHEMVKTYRQEVEVVTNREEGSTAPGTSIMRAVTGPDYGRITDAEVVDAVMRIAGNGTGDTNWKVPGKFMGQWGNYNPFVDPTKETTTLYASDRDVFIFLCDDTHPIEIGKLPNGDPDLIFRGFYVWNSEVGSKSLGIATMYLRGVCCNRILWGVEGFQEIRMRHSKYAPARFAAEHRPALDSFANSDTTKLLSGIEDARKAIVAQNDDERLEFLQNLRLSKPESIKIMQSVMDEEGHPAESVWDFVNGLTARARTIPHQDERINHERIAKKLLDKIAA